MPCAVPCRAVLEPLETGIPSQHHFEAEVAITKKEQKAGDVVLDMDEEAPRSECKPVRDLETVSGKDGFVQRVKVLLGGTRLNHTATTEVSPSVFSGYKNNVTGLHSSQVAKAPVSQKLT